MKLSAVVLAKNNQNTIENTLKSLQFCDEIIVIDDYSTDKTLQIASRYNAVIFRHKLSDNFAKQRNFGLSKAAYEWVIFVDSDEIVPKKLAVEIKKQLFLKIQSQNGFYIKRYDELWGEILKNGEIGSLRILRLGKKNAGKWIGKVHEIWDIKGKTGELRSELLHFPHQSISDFLKDINYYTTLRADEMYKKQVKVYALQIIFYPVGKFVLNYFFKFGFLDGIQGLMLAIAMSFHSFLVRSKLWQLYDQKKYKTA